MIWSNYVNIINTKEVIEKPKWLSESVPLRELCCKNSRDALVVPSSLDLKLRHMPINIFDNAGAPIRNTQLLRGKHHDFFDFRPKDVPNGLKISARYESVYYLGWLIPHYGHFLMESLSRLWAIDHANENTYFLFNVYNGGEDFLRNAKWACEMLKSLGVSEDKIIFATKAIAVDNIIIPSQGLILHSAVASDAQRFTWSKIRDRYSTNDDGNIYERIYLSRRLFKKQKRVLVNEEDVERLFESFGFKVIYPEQLSFSEQVKLFANADMVAGPSGSALHNSAFMKPHSKLLSLTTNSFCLLNETLACLPNSIQYSIFFGEDTDGKKWTVPLSDLEVSLKAMLDDK